MKYGKYFIGAEAGCIGRTGMGYPIPDFQLVMEKSPTTNKVKAIYQVQKIFGIMEDGKFVKVTPSCRNVANCMAEPEYETTYLVGDKQIPENELTIQYEVKDVTDIVNAIAAFEGKDSPYVSIRCLDIFRRNRLLSGHNPEDRAIIAAVKAAMNG